MNLNINKDEIAMRILEELQKIAFGDDVKPNHKLTAIRLLIKFLSLDESEQSEEKDTVAIIDDICGCPDYGTRGRVEREEYSRIARDSVAVPKQTQSEQTRSENRRQRRERERRERHGQPKRTQSEQTRSERTQSEQTRSEQARSEEAWHDISEWVPEYRF
ncbi:MAG: hypothetical protein LBI36_01905 [Oscillospiraceae bacterium]|nr:hypothetical protein [Oscillospiraceae bacterium]